MAGTTSKNIRLMCLALLGAGLIAGVAYWSAHASCEVDERAMAGEVKRGPDGTLMYFDGRCWTSKPTPPLDTPF